MFDVQFITHYNQQISYLESARVALEGGCKWIQLRMKQHSVAEIEEVGKEIRQLCNRYNATFILDDHVELVKKLKADGVHLGMNDMSIEEARQTLGDDYIIGGTANSFETVKAHYKHGANYVGVGPFRFTKTKENLSQLLHLEGYQTLLQKMKEDGIDIPVVAIGGILYRDVFELMQTGITGVALSGAILNHQRPIYEMERICLLVKEIKK